MELINHVLLINPEYYSLWNRKRILIMEMNFNNDELIIYGKNELKMLDMLLTKSPKSYWLWNHRRWLLESFLKDPTLWIKELAAVNHMLDLDARNFHGWDYRRYILQQAPHISSPLEEFQYTQSKIQQNFSNYSAWHYRSKLLPIVFPGNHLYSISNRIIYSI